ncbi:ubiquinol-cytochrome c reductase iron-sulfur subunit [Kroppenstedtia eburnea]|uniref:Menaquinol:cytochrome c reductase iron-sulfur subunit n=1 Tax=Kroppenstedtia eburnea TaxID=714067 RepID=A0A1N7IQJ5_9BACL|nr:ubiquinol-cytochrome c reductase iron-sulfur subunit [Kroppenstedtia eburnea]QKI82076.1 ubiquinol-cytochrome c reductase iron-sulfur subunit [Kroppenstedtia eburnea]SIS39251.1 menaquinol-cytochrome c reductase iron-sulfur subunit [Kroppenstedtia eburnea]
MSEKKSKQQKPGMSRRRFLTYTIASTGGFLASGVLFPMIRFAVDPLLQKGTDTKFVDVGPVEEFGSKPKSVEFRIKRKDGWYMKEGGEKSTAWVAKHGTEILALSPVCKHLGCTVKWEGGGHLNQFYCPCHGGLYTKDGVNVPGTPPNEPLDTYAYKVENGRLLLGPITKRGGGA